MVLSQGDIVRIEGISAPVFVASTKVFNDEDMIIGCPVLDKAEANALHYRLEHSSVNGIVFCEQLKYFDLRKRKYSYYSCADIRDCMEIVDIIQGIFEYSGGMRT